MKPILFNTEMIRAIQDGRKYVTRRVVKEPYYIRSAVDEDVARISGLVMRRGTKMTDGMPYHDRPYQPSDILYVRETWARAYGKSVYYRADYGDHDILEADQGDVSVSANLIRWHPSICPKTTQGYFYG